MGVVPLAPGATPWSDVDTPSEGNGLACKGSGDETADGAGECTGECSSFTGNKPATFGPGDAIVRYWLGAAEEEAILDVLPTLLFEPRLSDEAVLTFLQSERTPVETISPKSTTSALRESVAHGLLRQLLTHSGLASYCRL